MFLGGARLFLLHVMFALKKLLVIWLMRGDGEQSSIGTKRVMCKMVDLVEREDEK